MAVARSRSRFGSLKADISRLSSRMLPESGLRIPAMRLRNVVLPEPLSPLSATWSFSGKENDGTSITGWLEPSGPANDFLSLEISSSGMDCRSGSKGRPARSAIQFTNHKGYDWVFPSRVQHERVSFAQSQFRRFAAMPGSDCLHL